VAGATCFWERENLGRIVRADTELINKLYPFFSLLIWGCIFGYSFGYFYLHKDAKSAKNTPNLTPAKIRLFNKISGFHYLSHLLKGVSLVFHAGDRGSNPLGDARIKSGT
jgi:hypothetical protein